MTADVRSIAAQRDKTQRDADNRLLAEADRIRDGLSQGDKRRNSGR